MSEFVMAARLDEIPDPGQLLVEVDDQLVVLFHVDGQVYCLDDVCTHDGGPLGEGVLSDHAISCPRHGAKFDIRSGAALTMPATEATRRHQVKTEDGLVYVRIFGEDNAVTDANESHEASAFGTAGESLRGDSAATGNAEIDRPRSSIVPIEEPAAVAGVVTEDRVMDQLRNVVDPELFVNIVDLGLVYVIGLSDGDEGKTNVTVDMTMTSPACPAGPQLIADSRSRIGQLDGIGNVEIRIVMDPPWTPDRMTDEARDQLGIF
ncbi:MAG: iron-sulfur cluster assembly protein [Pirellulaceae bacterium]|nr:DUF59 domain-containing protein [Planctomycetales bacterium]